ncbi:hypothetical protein DL546_005521 [Coniochaeta pulveracea]|uniref:Uncharacterized protein n=1 Tax=Coniochaeta pulveracea TaxID=177199 RepID=A0A420Y6T9_9PEZI|nr:hypothetical protein DL546_005521 [Coniochaeta pulveracea]
MDSARDQSPRERRRSFGIGGAGNIRMYSEASTDDFYTHPPSSQARRRSSAFSGSSASPDGASRRARFLDGVKSMFGNSSVKDEK